MNEGSVNTLQYNNYNRISRKCQAKLSPERLTFTGNFTSYQKLFDISSYTQSRSSMRQDILSTVLKKTESRLRDESGLIDENPMYEDPKDVVVGDKPTKPPRKRNIQGIAVASPRLTKDKSLLKEQRRKLVKKYETLITTLIDKCEENVSEISEKDTFILKLKDKLKKVLEYNKLFAEENDQLKEQHSALVKYIEECKRVIKEEKDGNRELEKKCKDLEDRVKQFELPDRDISLPPTVIPLVEVCMSCSSRQILLNQSKEQNSRLQKDMQALKDVLYRLNVQLSRYQEKLRQASHTFDKDGKEQIYVPTGYDGLDSLITASLGCKGHEAVNADDNQSNKTNEPMRMIDLTGLLSAQALAPLFDAYQENLQEKENLIVDYEKQFENINKKSKQIVEDNKGLTHKLNSMEEELIRVKQNYKKLMVEKETSDIEKGTLVERAERAENKLKEVYELYEDKMSAMMRDYETIHREYFSVKSALEASAGKVAQLDAMRARTVPADLHERRLDHCKRLLEELKHQYTMETERRTELIKNLEQQLKSIEEKYNKICQEHEAVKEELKTALKNVKLYRKAAVVFRQRVKTAAARAVRVRRSARQTRTNAQPLKIALERLEAIKHEIKAVKTRAYTSLEELERRIVEQERRAAQAQVEYRRELQRAELALEHKEGIIRSLIDKVADVEEVRLSQTNAHRLQGIISDSSPEISPSPTGVDKKERRSVKLVPGGGGYYQDKKRGIE